MTRAVGTTLVMTLAVAALAAAVALTGHRPHRVARGPLAPGLVASEARRLELARGDRAIAIAITPEGTAVVAPSPGAADAAAVRDLVSAIAAARVDRFARHPIAVPRAVITVVGPGRWQLRLGEAVPATGQVWIGVDGDRAALVPSWVGAALDRDPDALRQRQLVAAAPRPTGLELHGPGVDLVLAGAALDRRDAGGVTVQLDRAAIDRLLAALAALTLVRFDPPTADAAAVGTVRVLGQGATVELSWFGPCPGPPGATQVVTTVGAGCVTTAALDAVLEAARGLATSAAIAAAPLADSWTPGRIAVVGGPSLERRGGGWTLTVAGIEMDADDAAVAATIAALTAPATARPRLAADRVDAEVWQVSGVDGTTATWRVRRGATVTIARDDEPVTLVVSGAAAAAIDQLGVALRARQLVRIDPRGVARIQATGVAAGTVERGAVIGEWRAGPGAIAAPETAALPARVAELQVEAWAPRSRLGSIRRTLALAFDHDAPVTIAIGAGDRAGCWIAIDAVAAARIAAAPCAQLLAPLTQRAP